jgi:hypothetical protein
MIAKELLQQRKLEILIYIKNLKKLENEISNLKRKSTKEAKMQYLKILKSNCILILYNSMEAVSKEAISDIFWAIKINSINYDNLTPLIKREIMVNLKKQENSPDNLASSIKTINQDIIHESFKRDTLFSGNVDAQKLRNISKKYGFQEPSYKKQEKLLEIKTARNKLAHGDSSFIEFGKDMTLTQIDEYSQTVIGYLENYIEKIEDYINQKKYLDEKFLKSIKEE